MKNKKGEIATLLTLGLVVVGTLITLGTSLFVSNKKTNLASSSMAACPKGVAITNSAYFKCAAGCGKTSGGSCPNYEHNSLDASCGYCGTAAAPAAGSGTTLPECTFKGTLLANTECGSSSNVTSSGCGKTSTGAQTYKCKTEPVAQPAADTKYSCCKVYETSSACGGKKRIQNQGNAFVTTCAHNSLVDCSSVGGPTTSGASICPAVVPVAQANTDTATGGIPGDDSTANQIAGGNPVVGTGQSCCFQKKGKVYVYSTYESMVNNDMLDDNGAPDCARQSAAVINSYQADSIGAFVCSGGTQNMTAIADYNAANPIDPVVPEDDIPSGEEVDNCIKRVGFKCSSGKTFDYYKSTAKGCESNTVGGSCYGTSKTSCSDEWNAFLKTQCEDAAPVAGAGSCTKRLGFKCSSAGYTGSVKTFDYYKSTGAGCTSNTVGGPCYGTSDSSCSTDWGVFLKSQCDVTVNPPAVVDNQCEKITCPSNKTGDYYRGKPPSTGYLYYDNFGACRDNISGVTNQNTIISKRCTTAINLGQNDLENFVIPNAATIVPPSTAFVLPSDFDINSLNNGSTYTLTIENPTEATCLPVRSGDVSCRNLGGTYLPKIEYQTTIQGTRVPKIPTLCCPLQLTSIVP